MHVLNFKTVVIILITFLFSIGNLHAQTKKNEVKDDFYKGGIDSLKKDFIKNYFAIEEKVFVTDHFLFFEITVNKKGIKNIRELYTRQSEVSRKILRAIEKTSAKWKLNGSKERKVIMPIFLIMDKESTTAPNPSSYTIISNDYNLDKDVIKGYILPPIIVNFFSQN